MTSVVLDASVLIAFLRCEPGTAAVQPHIAGSAISAVNYSEVLKKTIEANGTPELVQTYMHSLAVEVVPFDEKQAEWAAALYSQSKYEGLSFADRACLSLGLCREATVLTTEAAMGRLELPVRIKVIRGKQ